MNFDVVLCGVTFERHLWIEMDRELLRGVQPATATAGDAQYANLLRTKEAGGRKDKLCGEAAFARPPGASYNGCCFISLSIYFMGVL